MDFCRNISVSGGIPTNYPPEKQLLPPSCTLDDLFSGHSMEEGDINMEWLSIFVEDCLSSSGNCLPPTIMPSNLQSTTFNAHDTNCNAQRTAISASPDSKFKTPHLENHLSMHKLVVPCKARSKRKRSIFKGTSPLCTDPPLLHQAYWLADSELILPNKSTTPNSTRSEDSGQGRYKQMKHEEELQGGYKEIKQEEETGSVGQGQGRKCTHCLSQRTPQWRAGPNGPKTLCNACGVRYKSGRLLPEYRPAKSPTFVSYKHSNSHKKVLEMRMCSSLSS